MRHVELPPQRTCTNNKPHPQPVPASNRNAAARPGVDGQADRHRSPCRRPQQWRDPVRLFRTAALAGFAAALSTLPAAAIDMSGAGIKQIQAKTVTFGASDMPLTPDELKKSGLIQFPTVIGGDVPVVNLDGVNSADLTLDGDTLAKIF